MQLLHAMSFVLEDEYLCRYLIANSSNCITGLHGIMYFESGLKAFITCEDLEQAGNKVSNKAFKIQDNIGLIFQILHQNYT